ncbi:uncharacterized protein LOC111031630 [Myzus persicae]|uniref:uncharacterized protein LOC111031630 n=1 Tax=Myzus persicae TaxID=13164 RepID=UPI000B938320|nr:uncharacterized protein LOC111031630 [Myzus persicae]
MRNDQLPEEKAESASTPDPRNPSTEGAPPIIPYAPLATLQDRLDALEGYFAAQRGDEPLPNNPPIARIAPTIAAQPSVSLPAIGFPFENVNMPGNRAVNISSFQLPNPTADKFSSAAAATTAANFFSTANSAGTAPATPRVAPILSTGRDPSYSATYASASTNTATYSSSPVRDATNTCLYCVASTSHALPALNLSSPPASNSDTDSATSPESVAANELLRQPVPGAFRRRIFADIGDEEMDEQRMPRKVAKLSEQHLMVNIGNCGGVDDDMMMDCTTSE